MMKYNPGVDHLYCCDVPKQKAPAVGWCFLFCGKKAEKRTGRRAAARKKAAGGRLFSPRVDSRRPRQGPGAKSRSGPFFPS